MKRVISCVMGFAAVMAVTAGQAMADPSCATSDAICVSTEFADEGSGNPLTGLSSKGPFHGIIALGTTEGETPALYLFLDGYDDGNYDPVDGYLGLNTADLGHTLLGLVGDNHGDFLRLGGNRSLLELLGLYSPTLTPEAFQNYLNLAKLAPNVTFLTVPGAGMPAIPDPSRDVLQPVIILLTGTN